MIEGFRIVDAHCHPIADSIEDCKLNAYRTPDNTKDFFSEMRNYGVDFCVGSVIRSCREPQDFTPFAETNAAGFELEKQHPDFYQTGIRINPLFLKDSIAEIEKYHEERFRALLHNVEAMEVFEKAGIVVWECRNCGHLIIGTSAPEMCPVCYHAKSYFQVKAENY
jgi:hypothetical protein